MKLNLLKNTFFNKKKKEKDCNSIIFCIFVNSIYTTLYALTKTFMNMKRIFTTIFSLCSFISMMAQGWPANYGGVMLQGFYWDSFSDSKWTTLEKQAKDLASVYDLIWIPQSGNCSGTSMGYDDCYWFPGGNHYTSSFGNEAQLRSMISTFKGYGLGTIADVVINHRKSISGWFGFPTETYNGVTYKMSSTDVVSDDDGGKAKTQATALGLTLGNAEGRDDATNKACEGWDGMRDLDHSQENVQTICKAYTKALVQDLGYTGFRYDMVKGYPSKYVGMYNANAGVQFSVGEYWDGNASVVQSWINGTKVNNTIQSGAFDFAFRYTCRDAQPTSWANDKMAYAYVYVDGGSNNGNWPGKTMTWNASRTVNGVTGWFEYTVPSNLTSGRAIFNDGASKQFPASGQSGLSIAGKSYCYDGTWKEVTSSNYTGSGVRLYFRIPSSASTPTYNYNKLNNSSIITNATYRRYAVTFVENHDTEYRSATAQQDPIRRDTLALNAWLLANPGTPCVFFKHWKEYKNDIKNMILARKMAGITNQSVYSNISLGAQRIVRQVGPSSSNYTLVADIGINPTSPGDAWVKILDGYHYRYYLNKSLETVWVSEPSQEVSADINVKVTAISNTTGAKVVYTTNGSNPTASSTSVASGATITVPKGSTLKVGLLKNGTVSGIITREYWESSLPPFDPYQITAHVNLDKSGWTDKTYCNFWTWGGDGTHTPSGGWPGDKITTTKTVGGKTWFCKTFTISAADDFVSFVFSTGTGSPQTVDMGSNAAGYNKDCFFEVVSEMEGNKNKVNDVTSQYVTGINAVIADQPMVKDNNYYTLSGQRIAKPTHRGVYIHQGKKIIIR